MPGFQRQVTTDLLKIRGQKPNTVFATGLIFICMHFIWHGAKIAARDSHFKTSGVKNFLLVEIYYCMELILIEITW